MIDIVARYAREAAKKPFLHLTFDEHTGEAGVLTRLEAFVDMIRRRKASGFGQPQQVGQVSRLPHQSTMIDALPQVRDNRMAS